MIYLKENKMKNNILSDDEVLKITQTPKYAVTKIEEISEQPEEIANFLNELYKFPLLTHKLFINGAVQLDSHSEQQRSWAQSKDVLIHTNPMLNDIDCEHLSARFRYFGIKSHEGGAHYFSKEKMKSDDSAASINDSHWYMKNRSSLKSKELKLYDRDSSQWTGFNIHPRARVYALHGLELVESIEAGQRYFWSLLGGSVKQELSIHGPNGWHFMKMPSYKIRFPNGVKGDFLEMGPRGSVNRYDLNLLEPVKGDVLNNHSFIGESHRFYDGSWTSGHYDANKDVSVLEVHTSQAGDDNLICLESLIEIGMLPK